MRGRPRIRPWLRMPRRWGQKPERGGWRLLPLVIGVGLALAVIFLIDSALRPTLTALARARVENAVTRIVNDAVNGTLTSEAISYSDLVTLEKDAAGQVSVLAAPCGQRSWTKC